jgi:metallophosphoesterase (TIGR03768 family)
MGLASAVVMMFLCSDALATPSGTSILQFNFVTVMTNTDVQPNASGNVNCKLDRRGTASNLQLKISLAKLDPNTPYQLIAYIDDDTNSTSVTQFTTGANGAFAVTYVQKANARSGEKLLPNALNPICSVRELDIVNGSGQTILQADLMDPDRLQYRLKRFMDNTGFIPAAVGALQINATKQSTRFRLRVSGLSPSTVYLLTINGNVAQTNTTDRAGKLNLTTLPPGSTDVLDINTLALSDSYGSNVVLTTDGSEPVLTTRQQTIRPLAIPSDTLQISPNEVSLYSLYGYSAWQLGPPEDEGQRFDLMPAGYTGATNTARLLSFFSMTDIHVTDKESPAEALYFGWSAPFQASGLFMSAYSPIVLTTTHVLDAAVKTINALHRKTPFDFGICLGDVANSTQLNELRWFIDVMDGQRITPSSGAHLGADTIDYQKPYQAAGLDRSIPWYEVIGNHDQFWMGTERVTDKVRTTQVGTVVLNMFPNALASNATEGAGLYVGVVDGTTRYGEVIKGGPTNLFATPPTVVADTNRLSIVTDTSSTAKFVSEFFNTASSPVGHGFNQTNTGSTAACYTFEPMTNMPIKVIVLDDTCKTNSPSGGPLYYGGGWIDAARLAWLTNELQMGQVSNQLMIVACHIPISPQKDLFVTNSASQQFYDYQTETNLIATLHNYPNLILLMAGHRHMNTVTPQPSPDPAHPEYGFWEVETASLRDFPQQFRTWQILRNSDNTISIVTTDVDPQVVDGSPASDSRGYAIGASRVFGNTSLTDTTSHAYNAELVKQLSPAMQTKIAGYGGPLSNGVVCTSIASGLEW